MSDDTLTLEKERAGKKAQEDKSEQPQSGTPAATGVTPGEESKSSNSKSDAPSSSAKIPHDAPPGAVSASNTTAKKAGTAAAGTTGTADTVGKTGSVDAAGAAEADAEEEGKNASKEPPPPPPPPPIKLGYLFSILKVPLTAIGFVAIVTLLAIQIPQSMTGRAPIGSVAAGLGLEISAYIDSTVESADAELLNIKGSVSLNNEDATDAIVVATLEDNYGNILRSQRVKSGSQGEFELALKRSALPKGGFATVRKIEVSAVHTELGWVDTVRRATVNLTPSTTVGTRWTIASGAPFLTALSIFVASVVLGLLQVPHPSITEFRYYSVVLFSLGFVIFMVYFISVTAQELGGMGKRNEVVSLGFANVYFGSYSKEAGADWVLSLTSPIFIDTNSAKDTSVAGTATADTADTKPATSTGSSIEDKQRASGDATGKVVPSAEKADKDTSGFLSQPGFGAPLWVLLLSVVGSGVFTISLVVERLISTVNFQQPGEVRKILTNLIMHQVYILFAPLGGIVIYQLLLTAGSVSQPITVGLAALASGVALNAILKKAMGQVSKLTETPKLKV